MEALSLRAEIQLTLGNATAALGDLDRVVQLEPEQGSLLVLPRPGAPAPGRPAKAEADLTQALTLDPKLQAARGCAASCARA